MTSYLGLKEYAGYLLILYFAITLISTPFWYIFGKKFSNMYLLQIGTLITLIGFMLVSFTSASNWEIYILVIFITGIGIGVEDRKSVV